MAVPQTKTQTLELTSYKTIKQLLHSNRARLATALPRHISPEYMTRTTLNALYDSPALLACTPESLLQAIIEAATNGWIVGGAVPEAYLVPYGKKCTLIPGYRGLISLAQRSGRVKDIIRGVVHQADQFVWDPLDEKPILHRPAIGKQRIKSPIVQVYCVARYSDGSFAQPLVLASEEIDDHKQRFSQAWKRAEQNGKKDSPWHTSWKEMALKTVIRAYIVHGYVPVSSELMDYTQREQESILDVPTAPEGERLPAPDVPETQDDTGAGETEEPVLVPEEAQEEPQSDFAMRLAQATSLKELRAIQRKFGAGKSEEQKNDIAFEIHKRIEELGLHE